MNQTSQTLISSFLKGFFSPALLWIVVFIGLSIIVSYFTPYIKGRAGEAGSSFALHRLPKKEYTVLNNIMLKTDIGTTQIDHIVVSKYGVFVIETKNYSGLITGTRDADQWTQRKW